MITEDMVIQAEQYFGVNKVIGCSMEAFTIGSNDDRVLMKVSSPNASHDLYFADIIKSHVAILNIPFTQSGRDVTISIKDFMSLFGGEN
jgi:hypothetical protein